MRPARETEVGVHVGSQWRESSRRNLVAFADDLNESRINIPQDRNKIDCAGPNYYVRVLYIYNASLYDRFHV